MANTIAKKLKINEDFILLTLHAPESFEKRLLPLPAVVKKEYIEWIVTAKREETRIQRIDGTIERLVKGWKNPRNM